MQPNELMELVTKLSNRVVVLKNDLKQTKKTYGDAFTKLIKKVKTLEKTIMSSKARRRAQFVVANIPVSIAGAEVSTAAKILVYIRRSEAKRKDKGKAIVEESEPKQTKTKIQQEQERHGFEEAQRLQEQFDEEERQ
ncbi:hypothetical protein Tco_0283802, partial [Tanacetum coccineum]